MALSTKLLRRTAAKANKIEQERLGLHAGDDVIRIARIMHRDGSPPIFELIVLPARLFPGIERESRIAPDISELALQYGLVLGRAIEGISVIEASSVIAQHLEIEAGAPALKLDRVTDTTGGLAVEWRQRFQAMAEQ